MSICANTAPCCRGRVRLEETHEAPPDLARRNWAPGSAPPRLVGTDLALGPREAVAGIAMGWRSQRSCNARSTRSPHWPCARWSRSVPSSNPATSTHLQAPWSANGYRMPLCYLTRRCSSPTPGTARSCKQSPARFRWSAPRRAATNSSTPAASKTVTSALPSNHDATAGEIRASVETMLAEATYRHAIEAMAGALHQLCATAPPISEIEALLPSTNT
jgi:hypothetical protein